MSRSRVDCRRDELERFATQELRKTDRVALEATTNTWPVVDILRPRVAQLVVGNPLKTKAIAEAKVKTDKVDAEVLAQLLRCEYLPDVWQPDAATQRQRSLLTHRCGLMCQRARHKNRMQCMLNRLLIKVPCRCLWTKAGLTWLRTLELSSTDRLMLDSELRQLQATEQELIVVNQQLVEIAREEPRIQLLMTLPGASYVVVMGLLSAIGDVTRFRDGDHLASYLGLVPITRQSANKCYHGRITKARNPQVRWLLTQACQHVSGHPGPLGGFFRRLARRKPRHVALMGLARKLVTVAYLMLKHNEPYRNARPQLLAEKFTNLSGKYLPKEPRPQPSPLRRSAKQGLPAVYDEAGLPPTLTPEQFPAGEQRMLAEQHLTQFVEELHHPDTTK